MKAVNRLLNKNLFPPQGVKVQSWVGTPDLWGILVFEADSAADAFKTVELWRASAPGFLKSIKTAPASPIQDIIPVAQEILKNLGIA